MSLEKKPTKSELMSMSLEELEASFPEIDPGELINMKMDVMVYDHVAETEKKVSFERAKQSQKEFEDQISNLNPKPSYMADEDFYLKVETEIKEGTKSEALWSKAKILALDKKTEPDLEYTKLRVEQLKKQYREEMLGFKTEKVVEKSIEVGVPLLKWGLIIFVSMIVIGVIGALISNA